MWYNYDMGNVIDLCKTCNNENCSIRDTAGKTTRCSMYNWDNNENRKIKPCPFCGDTVHIQYESDAKAFSVWHDTKECMFIHPLWIDGEHAKSLSEAYKIWNERVET